MTDVPNRLLALAELYRQRNQEYGNDYKRHGSLMLTLFPHGLELRTPADFNRYGVFKLLVAKIGRYAANWDKGGHVDSLNDISVYAQMLNKLDEEGK